MVSRKSRQKINSKYDPLILGKMVNNPFDVLTRSKDLRRMVTKECIKEELIESSILSGELICSNLVEKVNLGMVL